MTDEELKSHAREEAIVQLRNILERFRRFFPEHKDKAVYGILAALPAVDTRASVVTTVCHPWTMGSGIPAGMTGPQHFCITARDPAWEPAQNETETFHTTRQVPFCPDICER